MAKCETTITESCLPGIESWQICVEGGIIDNSIPPKDKSSLEYGQYIARTVNLESEIKNADKSTTGSNAYLDLVMNVHKERHAIENFYNNFVIANSDLSEQEVELQFNQLLDKWLTSQYEFCLSENGCNKFLQVQPNYCSLIIKDKHGHQVKPSDISQFNDLSKKYVEENPRVGAGLQNLYSLFANPKSPKQLYAAIVSGTEEYQDYNSKTDVLNLWVKTKSGLKESEVKGKYLVLNRVLSLQERRFLHNLFSGLSTNKFTIRQLLEMDEDKLKNDIIVSELVVIGEHDLSQPEYQTLVTNPNSFVTEIDSDDPLFSLTQQLNQIFLKRFKEPLIDIRDLEMYPVIKSLVQTYLPDLKTCLLQKSVDDYYACVRQMLYHCQALWANNQSVMPDTHKEVITQEHEFSKDDEWFMFQHLDALMNGVIMAGFEFADSSSDPFSQSFNSVFDPSQPLGWEIVKICEQHGEYTGDHCEKCKKHSNK